MKQHIKETDYLKSWIVIFVITTAGIFFAFPVTQWVINHFPITSLSHIFWLILGAGFLIGIPVSYVVLRFAVIRFILPKIRTSPAARPSLP